jgi:UDP-3-O-[3-hydroxymyristoyl] N-acetylglucosamine deacetylase
MTPYDALQPTLKSGTAFPAGAVNPCPLSYQHTLRGSAECSGIGVHSGEKVRLRLLPAPENTGITFIRTDVRDGARHIPARWDHVVDTRLCTVIANDHGSKVATIEHLMAALYAYGIDNAVVEIDQAEVPVMDGSSDSFVFLIEMAGVVEQKVLRPVIEVLTPVQVGHNGKQARLLPAVETRYSVAIDFDRSPISRQSYDFILSADGFKTEIGRARTFGFFEDVDQLRKAGLARGGSLHNAIVIKDHQVLNEDGLRYEDEFVRHKLLDAVGDLALAGAPIRGHFQGTCCGHALNNQLLRALFADTSAWRWAVVDELAGT